MRSFVKAGLALLAGLVSAFLSKATTADDGALIGAGVDGRQISDNVMGYRTGDLAMEEAGKKARATLQRFFQLSDARLHGSYLLKMSLTNGALTEHIWMNVTGYRGGVFRGTLANDPATPGYRIGDPVILRREDIEDWMINTGTARYGGYTLRAMLKDMPKEQAEALRAQLRD